MYRRFTTASYIVFTLIGIGVLSKFVSDPRGMIIPLVVFGAVFFFLKFPPKRLMNRRNRYNANPYGKSKVNPKHKQVKFHVIRGNKSDDPEEPPKYH